MFKVTRTAVRGELNQVRRGKNLLFINVGVFCVCVFTSFFMAVLSRESAKCSSCIECAHTQFYLRCKVPIYFYF